MNRSLRILVVDDDHNMARTLADILRLNGCEATIAHSGAEALTNVGQSDFDCVLSDVRMPDVNGVDLYRAIKTRRPELPMVLMTAYSTAGLIQQGMEEGAVATLTKPVNIDSLLKFFSCMGAERSVTVIDDDPEFCRTLGDVLSLRGFAVTQATDPALVLDSLDDRTDVVLLDVKLGAVSCLDVLREIKSRRQDIAVVLMTAHRDEMTSAIQSALDSGAHMCLYKPLDVDRLTEVLKAIHLQILSEILDDTVNRRERVGW